MSTRSVRLDTEAEAALSAIMENTGLSISDAIKRGLIEYRDNAIKSNRKHPADFFNSIDLGEGGYAIAPAKDAKRAVKDKLKTHISKRSSKR